MMNTELFIANQLEILKERIGDEKVICALSGGVDSSVSAALVSRAIGKNLTCILVDHGLLRKNEKENVIAAFEKNFDLNLICIDAKDRFLGKLAGITDPEKKRKIIGEEFIAVFHEESIKQQGAKFLLQGTILSDVIESGSASGGLVKSHHNVGGLPEDMPFELVEPLRELLKHEVREVGAALGLPGSVVNRQPFPGPGLGIRIIGDITEEKLEILREADFIFTTEIEESGQAGEVWQYFAIFPGVSSTGVKNGERTYSNTIALRAVASQDAMTADWARIDLELLAKISNRILSEVEDVNRVVYDITAKPPGTIEWE